MRRVATLLTAALMLSACANPPGPASGGSPQTDPERMGIYEAVIRHLIGAEEGGWPKVAIDQRICDNAGDPEEAAACGDSFSTAEQQEMLVRLADLEAEVTFVDDPASIFQRDGWLEGTTHTVVVRVGPIDPHDEDVQVPGSYFCGGLCASGTTWVVLRDADGWSVTGNVGGMWIS
jgi:hypothetical protein